MHDAIRWEYEQDGYVIFRSVIDPDLIATANQHVDWLPERNPDLRPDQLRHEFARNEPFSYRLVSDPRLLDIAENFVDPDIARFATDYWRSSIGRDGGRPNGSASTVARSGPPRVL